MRYHKKVYWPINNNLKAICQQLNVKQWQYSNHCLDNLKCRFINIENILLFIKNLTLQADNIFEYYLNINNNIEKIVYRVNFTDNMDIIIVISVQDKKIITIYSNMADDEHYTLKKELYCLA